MEGSLFGRQRRCMGRARHSILYPSPLARPGPPRGTLRQWRDGGKPVRKAAGVHGSNKQSGTIRL
eukprot:3273453-Rhodomonas_salina.4